MAIAVNLSCSLFDMWYEHRYQVFNIVVFSQVVNFFLFVPTIILNAIILLTIWRTSSLHTPSNVFLFNLAVSDLAVALLATPLVLAWKLQELYGTDHRTTCILAYTACIVSSVFAAVSVLTIATATVDRYLALKLHLRYVSIVTVHRVIVVCVVHWVTAIGLGLLFLISLPTMNYIVTPSALLIIGVMVFCYFQIFVVIRHHHNQIHSQNSTNSGNMPHYRKSVMNLFCVLVLFVLFYSPYIIVLIVFQFHGVSVSLLRALVCSVVAAFANSAINPLVYCWRMRDIRQAVRETCLYIKTKVKCIG